MSENGLTKGDESKEVEMEGSEVKVGGKGKEVVVVMDTPDRSRSQIAAPISKFEESPVFNFLNNLSPIKPVKSVHITQTLNALSFASLPSVFTSPHVSSIKESRFLRRQQFVDPSKPEFSADTGNKTDAEGECKKVAHNNSNEQQEHIGPGNSNGEVSGDQSSDSSKLADELVRILTYECTPISSSKTSCAAESTCVAEFTSASGAVVPFEQPTSGKGLYGNGLSIEEMNQTSQSGDATGCDWENLLSDADPLIFNSPDDVGAAKKLLNPSTSLYTHISDMQNIQNLGPVEQGDGKETDDPSTQPCGGNYLKEFAGMQDMLVGSSMDNDIECSLDEKADDVPVSHLNRGMRRRCLVFEMGGARRKHFDGNSSSVTPILTQERNTSSTDKQLVPMRSGNDSSRHILPGIGLHLNALATAPKEYKVGKQDASVSGRLVIAPPSSMANFHSFTTGEEQVNQPLAINSMERDMDPVESAIPLPEDASQASANMIAEEFNQSSPKKKRRRVEQASESVGCKRCNCKKSKCLKLYCECFGAGVYCMEPCSCQGCFNKPIHEDTVLATRKQIESRNPLAFAPKVIRGSDSPAETGGDSTKTPASARHKRGCNCKKSGCLKKYCECYQGGVGCSISCRCEGCKNAFGRKDGSVFMGTGAETEDDEAEVLEKSVKERASHKTETQNDVVQNPESAPPATPFRFPRPLVQVAFSSKKKPPRSSLAGSIGTSSLHGSNQGLAKTAFLPPPQPKFDKQFEAAVVEDEMPEILQGNGSPISGIKSASPNSKRVSPPHCNFGISPGRRSSRKLILQSIPAFPSLTPKH